MRSWHAERHIVLHGPALLQEFVLHDESFCSHTTDTSCSCRRGYVRRMSASFAPKQTPTEDKLPASKGERLGRWNQTQLSKNGHDLFQNKIQQNHSTERRASTRTHTKSRIPPLLHVRKPPGQVSQVVAAHLHCEALGPQQPSASHLTAGL